MYEYDLTTFGVLSSTNMASASMLTQFGNYAVCCSLDAMFVPSQKAFITGMHATSSGCPYSFLTVSADSANRGTALSVVQPFPESYNDLSCVLWGGKLSSDGNTAWWFYDRMGRGGSDTSYGSRIIGMSVTSTTPVCTVGCSVSPANEFNVITSFALDESRGRAFASSSAGNTYSILLSNPTSDTYAASASVTRSSSATFVIGSALYVIFEDFTVNTYDIASSGAISYVTAFSVSVGTMNGTTLSRCLSPSAGSSRCTATRNITLAWALSWPQSLSAQLLPR